MADRDRRVQKDGLEALAREGAEPLVRRMSGMLRSEADAEDVVQETYLRLLDRTPSGPIANLRAYVSASARNLARDRLRMRQRRSRMEQPLDDHIANAAAAPACDPERRLEATQRLELVRAAIERLPPRCRQAFVMHRFHSLSYQEIAARLGVSKSSVEKYIIEALDACRRAVL